MQLVVGRQFQLKVLRNSLHNRREVMGEVLHKPASLLLEIGVEKVEVLNCVKMFAECPIVQCIESVLFELLIDRPLDEKQIGSDFHEMPNDVWFHNLFSYHPLGDLITEAKVGQIPIEVILQLGSKVGYKRDKSNDVMAFKTCYKAMLFDFSIAEVHSIGVLEVLHAASLVVH